LIYENTKYAPGGRLQLGKLIVFLWLISVCWLTMTIVNKYPLSLWDIKNNELVSNADSNNKYSIISHVWGDTKMYSSNIKNVFWKIPLSEPSKCKDIAATCNAVSAYKYIWIDAVCMNQSCKKRSS